MGKRVLWISLILVLTGTLNAQAALMTSAREAQLEAWLGMGDLEFTNEFTKQSGDRSVDFHDAVDGKVGTITLMQVTQIEGRSVGEPGIGNVIGGYNPRSWNSSGSANVSTVVGERTAFLFNLDTVLKLSQRPGVVLDGYYQTYNHTDWGPSFGPWTGGPSDFDLAIHSDLTNGSLAQFHYGSPASGNGFQLGTNLLGDSLLSHRTGAADGRTDVQFGSVEVYSFTPASTTVAHTPEPGSLAILGVLGVVACGRYRRRKTATQAA